MRSRGLTVVAFAALVASAQSGAATLASGPLALESEDQVLLAAGDIADCNSPGDEATALILDGEPGTIATLGDNAYEAGTADEFRRCYDPTWGRHKGRTRPAVGNHEYYTPNAVGYYAYFGASAGRPGEGYYSYELGSWHVVALNSECSAVGGCDPASPQGAWLEADLAASSADCTLAYWHHARFSSGPHGANSAVQPLWTALYRHGADVILSGHDHLYERFAPLTPSGALDTATGIRQFTVGTGGRSHYAAVSAGAWSEALEAQTFGVLKLTLRAGGYDWRFLPEAGKSYSDSGTASCHGRPGDSSPSPPPPAEQPEPSAPIRGTDRNDVLVGTPGVDVIYGGGGNDVIRGAGGDDVILGGRGRDTIFGGPGDDRLVSRDGRRDTVDGGPGRDRVIADRLFDRLRAIELRG